MIYSTTTNTAVSHNGPVCNICGVGYINSHRCRKQDIQSKIDWLKSLLEDTQFDSMSMCSCRPERGGSGVCGCILSGIKITC